MLPKSIRCAALAVFLLGGCLLASAGASVPSNLWKPDPSVSMTPAAIMADRTCADMPHDSNLSVNLTQGWERLATTEMSCGNKGGSGSFRCKVPSMCGELVFQMIPNDPKDRGKKLHALFDPNAGTVEFSAMPANQWGWRGAVAAKPIIVAAGATPKRATYEVTVPDAPTATTLAGVIKATGTEPVIIGQVGFAELPTPPG